MIWVQSLACFVLWIAYAVAAARRSAAVQGWVFRIPRSQRGLLAAGLFLVPSAALLGLLLIVAAAHALTPSGLALWAWLVVAVAGLGYVHAQTLATALLVSLAYEAVTKDRLRPSETPDSQGSTSDEAPSP